MTDIYTILAASTVPFATLLAYQLGLSHARRNTSRLVKELAVSQVEYERVEAQLGEEQKSHECTLKDYQTYVLTSMAQQDQLEAKFESLQEILDQMVSEKNQGQIQSNQDFWKDVFDMLQDEHENDPYNDDDDDEVDFS